MLNFPWKWSIEVTKPLLTGLLIFFVVAWLTESWRKFLWFCFACGNDQKLCIAAYLLKYGHICGTSNSVSVVPPTLYLWYLQLCIYDTSNSVSMIPQTPYLWYHSPTFFWSSSINGEPPWLHPQRAEIGSSKVPLLHEYCWNKHTMPADGNISTFSRFLRPICILTSVPL